MTPTTTLVRGARVRLPSNGTLVLAAGAGDQDAWRELVARHTGLLCSVARSFGLGTADSADAVQNTWLRLTENLHRLRDPESVCGWLATTARTECLRTLRRRRHAPAYAPDLEVVSAEPGPEQRALTADRDRRLLAALDRLPERDALLLRVLSACPTPSYVAVAAHFAMPVGSIGPTRARALARLRAELAADGLDSLR